MNNKDVLELKRRMKKDECTFTRVCGCYVDAERNKITKLGNTFLNLEEEEYYKYLEIAKKVLSGKVGNNILTLNIDDGEKQSGGRKQFYMGLRDSKLKNDELLDVFYDMVIDSYDYVGNYLILVFHDAYDVMTRTSDNKKLDESEEVYEYLLCAICPVALSKPALGYLDTENKIGPRIRDWVVGMPDTGFVFPAFNDRSTDADAFMFYTKNTKNPHEEFMEVGLGCQIKKTATEQRAAFVEKVVNAVGGESEEADDTLYDVQKALSELIDEKEDKNESTELPLQRIEKILMDAGIDADAAKDVTDNLKSDFEDELPIAENLLDEKIIEDGRDRKEKRELQAENELLREKLEMKQEDESASVKTYDVVLRVKPEKEGQIHIEQIKGSKCIVIPLEESECAVVNGTNKLV